MSFFGEERNRNPRIPGYIISVGAFFALILIVSSGIISQDVISTSNSEILVLVEDVINDLQANDTVSASIHLRLVQQQLSQIKDDSASRELISTLVNDTLEDLENKDISSALTHLNLTSQQLMRNTLITAQVNQNNAESYWTTQTGAVIQNHYNLSIGNETFNITKD